MNQVMTEQESYAERRKLFKNIWETSLNVDEKEDITSKPKIIKTLRLDELDRTIGKNKKQKIKNLRTVCNKLLDFCDRQDADDLFYEKMAAQKKEQPKSEIETSVKTKKQIKIKRKIKKAKSMFSPKEITLARATTSDRKDDLLKGSTASRYTSPIKFKRTSVGVTKKKKSKQNAPVTIKNKLPGDDNITQNRRVRKKRSKKTNPSIPLVQAGPTLRYKYFSFKRLITIKKPLQLNILNIG